MFAQPCVANNPAFGCVNPPPQLKGDLVILFNNVLRLVFLVAGIYAFLRFLVAGMTFINAGGDAKKISQAWASIWQSLVGLVIIIGSFALAAIIGHMLFGDWQTILNPQIYGPV